MSWRLARKLRKLEKLEARARRKRRETFVRGQQTAVLAYRGGRGALRLVFGLLRFGWRTTRWAWRAVTARPTGFGRR